MRPISLTVETRGVRRLVTAVAILRLLAPLIGGERAATVAAWLARNVLWYRVGGLAWTRYRPEGD